MPAPIYIYPEDFEGTPWTVVDGAYYVSNTGSDSAPNDGSPKRPFLTVERAMEIAEDGEKIIVGPDVPDGPVPEGGAHLPCRVATTGDFDLSTGGLQTIDDVTLTANDRVLVWQQADDTQNGIYLASAGSWSRAIDLNANFTTGGKLVAVNEGTLYGGRLFQHTTVGAITFGTTSIVFDIHDWATPKGLIDCSADPDYPEAKKGDYYYVSANGNIGGASGLAVTTGMRMECTVDHSDSGNQTTVGTNWRITGYYSIEKDVKVNHLTVTQDLNLDQMKTDIDALANGMVYKGDWDASSGSYPGSGAAQTGWFYYVSVGGTVDGIEFSVGDNIVATVDNASASTYSGNWSKHDQTDFALSDGKGTTANGTAVDLGGSFSTDVTIGGSSGAKLILNTSQGIGASAGLDLQFDELVLSTTEMAQFGRLSIEKDLVSIEVENDIYSRTSLNLSTNSITIAAENNLSQKDSISVGASGITVNSAASGEGMYYASDYSLAATDRWIPDKGYVDDKEWDASDIISGSFADGRVSESSVTQHQTALIIAESQISDLGAYITNSETQGATGQISYMTGDILYASSANVLSKLSAGTNGQVLTLASGVPTWASISDVNNYVTGVSFATGTGLLILTRSGLSDLSVDLDGRYLTGNQSINLSGQLSGSGTTSISAALTVSAITGQTALTSGLASTDELLVNDGGALKRMDVSVIQSYMQSNLSFLTGNQSINLSGQLSGSGTTSISASLTASAVTGQTALTSGLLSTDELLVSDGGVLKRMDISVIESYMQSNLSFGSSLTLTGDITGSGSSSIGTTLQASAITGKTALTSGLSSTDELLISDGGVLKRMDLSVLIAGQQSSLTSGLSATDELLVSDSGTLKKMDISVLESYVNNALASDKSGEEGYYKTHDGIIVQWGRENTTGTRTVSFPTTFPSACRSVVVMGIQTSGHSANCPTLDSLPTSSSFTVNVPSWSGLTQKWYWMAIGY